LGEILFDLLAGQPDRPLEMVTSWIPFPGGAPANVACGLAKLGTPSAFIGCVGQDAAGDELISVLEGAKVDTSGIQRHPTAPTRKVYVTRTASGERHFAGFGDTPTDRFADVYLDGKKLAQSLFLGADYLVMGTLELAYPDSRQAIYRALELARKHQVKVLIDINWREVFWLNPENSRPIIFDLLQQADIIKCSQEDGEWLFNTQDHQAILQHLPDCPGVLVTAGEKGCTYRLGNTLARLDVFPVKSVDATGAGDSFLAGFLHQFRQHGAQVLKDAALARKVVTYASAAGALTTLKPGAIAAQPTAGEVEAFLRKSPN
jgi:fructokinase